MKFDFSSPQKKKNAKRAYFPKAPKLLLEYLEDRTAPAVLPPAIVEGQQELGTGFSPFAAVDPLDPDKIVVVGSSGVFLPAPDPLDPPTFTDTLTQITGFYTTDGGEHWNQFTVAQDYVDPDKDPGPNFQNNISFDQASQPTVAFGRDGSFYISHTEHDSQFTKGVLVVHKYDFRGLTPVEITLNFDDYTNTSPGPGYFTTGQVIYEWKGQDPAYHPYVAVDNNIHEFTDQDTEEKQTDFLSEQDAVFVAWNTDATAPDMAMGFNPNEILISISGNGGLDFSTPQLVSGTTLRYTGTPGTRPEILFTQGTSEFDQDPLLDRIQGGLMNVVWNSGANFDGITVDSYQLIDLAIAEDPTMEVPPVSSSFVFEGLGGPVADAVAGMGGSGSMGGTNEVQTLTETMNITGGSYTLTFMMEETVPLAFDASASEIQLALEGLTTISSGNVMVTGGPVNNAPVMVTFINALSNQNVPTLTSDQSNLTGSFSIAVDTQGMDPPDMEVETEFTLPVDLTTQMDFDTLVDLEVNVHLVHDHMNQVSITLEAPDGTQIPLVLNRVDTMGMDIMPLQGLPDVDDFGVVDFMVGMTRHLRNFGGTFDDQAPRNVHDGNNVAPYTVSYQPEAGFLSVFNGLDGAALSGDWKLIIADFNNDTMMMMPPVQFLRSWSIKFVSHVNTTGFGDPDPFALPPNLETEAFFPTFDVQGAPDSVYPLNNVTNIPRGIGPWMDVAIDDSLGSFSPYQGRMYLVYTDLANPNDPDNTDIFLIHSDDNGQSWSFPARVNSDSALDFTEGSRPQFMPNVDVDPVTGTVVVTWYDARWDAAQGRVTTFMTTSIDGGETFSEEIFLNPPKIAIDAITGEEVVIEPIPTNLPGVGLNGLGERQSVVVHGGKVHAFWSGNLNANQSNIWHGQAGIASGPRVVQGDSGSVVDESIIEIVDFLGNPIDQITINPNVVDDALSGAPLGAKILEEFSVTFDRPVDPSTISPEDVVLIYRDPNDPSDLDTDNDGLPGKTIAVTSVEALDKTAAQGPFDDEAFPALTVSDEVRREGDAGNTSFTFDIFLTEPLTEDLTIFYTVRSGTADENDDYTPPVVNQAFIPAGFFADFITVDARGDTLEEDNETFFLDIVGIDNNKVTINKPRGTATILDDDGPLPKITIFPSSGFESTGIDFNTGLPFITDMDFTVFLSEVPTDLISVDYTILSGTAEADVDFEFDTDTITFFPGVSTREITVSILADSEREPDETLFVELSNPVGANFGQPDGNIAMGTIIDDEEVIALLPAVSIGNGIVRETDFQETSTISFPVELSLPLTEDLTLEYTTTPGTADENDDFQPTTGTVTIPAGELGAVVDVVVNGDTFFEGNENFFIDFFGKDLRKVTFAKTRGEGTIVDNDVFIPELNIADVIIQEQDYQQNEIDITILLSSPAAQDITVDFRTEDGSALQAEGDYTGATGTLFIPMGTSEITFTANDVLVPIVNGDGFREGNEFFNLILENPTNANLGKDTATVTIMDDDNDLGATQFLINIEPQTAVGTYSYSIGPEVFDRIRVFNENIIDRQTAPTVFELQQTGGIQVGFDDIAGPDPADLFPPLPVELQPFFLFSPPTPFGTTVDLLVDSQTPNTFEARLTTPDGNPMESDQYVQSTIQILLPGAADPLMPLDPRLVIKDLNVRVTIGHQLVSDLALFLTAPNGKRVFLSLQNGGTEENYFNTVFDDGDDNGPSPPISEADAPFTGVFAPEEPLAELIGDQIAPDIFGLNDREGLWTLGIIDLAPQSRDIELFNWSLIFEVGEETTLSGNKMDQNNNGEVNRNRDLVESKNFNKFKTPDPINGASQFELPYDDLTLPLILPGPRFEGTSLDLNPATTENLLLNDQASFVDVVFDRQINPNTFLPEHISTFIGPFGPVDFDPTTPQVDFGPQFFEIVPNPGGTPPEMQDRIFRVNFLDSNGDPFSIRRSGTYSLVVLPVVDLVDQLGNSQTVFIEDSSGRELDNNLNAGLENLRGKAPFPGDRLSVTFSTLTDGDVTNDNVEISANRISESTLVVPDSFIIDQVDEDNPIEVRLNISHQDVLDLEATLIAPDGTEVRLFGNLQPFGAPPFADFTDTVLNDFAQASILQAQHPFTGTFTPQLPLSTFNGSSANGTWTLRIVNNGLTVGSIDDWTLSLPRSNPATGLAEPVGDQFSVNFRIFTQDPSQEISQEQFAEVGPVGQQLGELTGRATAIAIDPSDPLGNTVYVGGAYGGLWKTTNFLTLDPAGPTWVPLANFGLFGAMHIGSIAIVPRNNDPNQSIIFVGTGSNEVGPLQGVGVLRSLDGGRSWKLLDSEFNSDPNNLADLSILPFDSPDRDHRFVGWQVTKIVADPVPNANGDFFVYMTVSGTPKGGNVEPGLYRSSDTGRSWELIRAGQATDAVLAPSSAGPNGNLGKLYVAFAGEGVFVTESATVTSSLDFAPGGLGVNSRTSDYFDPATGTLIAQDVIIPILDTDFAQNPQGQIVLATPVRTGNPVEDLAYQDFIYALVTGGPDDALYMSKDAGDNWTKIVLPGHTVGFFSFAFPTNDETKPETTAADWSDYSASIAVDPNNPYVVYIGTDSAVMRVDTTKVSDAHTFIAFDNSDGDMVPAPIATNTIGAADVRDNFVWGLQDPTLSFPFPKVPENLRQNFLHLRRDPSIPFLTTQLDFTNVLEIQNTGTDGEWFRYGDFIEYGLPGFSFQAELSFDEFTREIVTTIDPFTGQTRVIAGNDFGVFSGIDSGDGTSFTDLGFNSFATGSRNGNLALGEFSRVAIQPSLIAADIANALIYAVGDQDYLPNTFSVPSSSPDLLQTGNVQYNDFIPSPLPGLLIQGSNVETAPSGSGLAIEFLWPNSIEGVEITPPVYSRFDFLHVLGPGGTRFVRNVGLFNAGDNPPAGQWTNNTRAFQPTTHFTGGGILSTGYSFTINPRDPRGFLLGSRAGRVFRSFDDAGGTGGEGEQWEPIGEPAELAGNNVPVTALAHGAPLSDAPDILNEFIYAGFQNGEIFVTFNGGGQWENISQGLTGTVLEILADPQDQSKRAIAVTTTGVFLSDDTQNFIGWRDITGNLFSVERPIPLHPNEDISVIEQTTLNFLTSGAVDWRFPTPVLYVSGDKGIYRSVDLGSNWTFFPEETTSGNIPIPDGGFIPHTVITDIDLALGAVDPNTGLSALDSGFNVLVASTQGRGVSAIRLDLVPEFPGPRIPEPFADNVIPQLGLNGTTGILVKFDGPVDAGSFTAADVVITDPNGQVVDPFDLNTTVTDVTPPAQPGQTQVNSEFLISFPEQTLGGVYTIQIGPNLTDPAGNLMNQDDDTINGEPVEDMFVFDIFLNNKPPVIDDVPNQVMDIDETLVVDLSVMDPDVHSSPLQISAVSSDQSIIPNNQIIITPGANPTITLTADMVGTTEITVTVTDPFGLTDTDQFFVTVTETLSLIVDTLVDEDDGDFSVGDLSLREAIRLTNENTSSPDDTIDFDPALTGGTINLVAGLGDLQITDDVIINGLGANLLTVNGGGAINIFTIDDGDDFLNQRVTISGLTLTGGAAGGGDGGAIHTKEDTFLRDLNITMNSATRGGGVYADAFNGFVFIHDSFIIDNDATVSGGGLDIFGDQDTRVIIDGSVIALNEAPNGAGLNLALANASQALLSSSQVEFNTATVNGGGIRVNTIDAGTEFNLVASNVSMNQAVDGAGIYSQSSNGSLIEISLSEISENEASNNGGALYSSVNLNDVRVLSSTISGNRADENGGGVFGISPTLGGIILNNATVANNTSDADSNGSGSGGGVFNDSVFLFSENTIIAGNVDNTGTAPDVSGDIGADFSIIGDTTGGNVFDNGGNKLNVDPLLGPLVNNGGTTRTHALTPTSPAIDMGSDFLVLLPTVDQRGVPFQRFVGTVDIGAFERQTIPNLSLIVDTLVDENDGDFSPGDLSLREAVALANGSAGPDVITFAPALSGGTITLAPGLGEMLILEDVVIDGLGQDQLAVDGGGFNRIFNIDDFNNANEIDVTIDGLTLSGGNALGDGGAIWNAEHLIITDSTFSQNTSQVSGGAIANMGTLEITNSLISQNTAVGGSPLAGGGGIYNNGGIVTLTNTNVDDNEVTNSRGGGILNVDGELTVNGGTISHNETAGDGGGIATIASTNSATAMAMLNAVQLNSNEASGTGSSGGAVYNSGDPNGVSGTGTSTVTIVANTIFDNQAGNGGGISNVGVNATITLRDSTVYENQADLAGGIGNFSGGTTNIINSTLSANIATSFSGGAISTSSGTVDIDHSTIAGNEAMDVGGGIHQVGGLVTADNTLFGDNISVNGGPDVFGDITANFSLIEDDTDSNITGANNVTGFDPLLGPLQNNGGITDTHALLPGSPAIDAGDPNFTPPPDFDQRNNPFIRVFDGDGFAGANIDIGAYEIQAVTDLDSMLIVDILTDENDGNYDPGDRSLREMINLANGSIAPNTITFDPSIAGGTITLTMGQLTISDNLTLIGLVNDSISIDGNDTHRVFDIDDNLPGNDIDVTIQNLMITGGVGEGGGIHNNENLTLINTTVAGNADSGIKNNKEMEIINSTISGNTSTTDGAGIYNTGNLILTNTTIANNDANNMGGAIYSTGTVTMGNTLISGNKANIGREIANDGGTVNANANNLLGESSSNLDQAFMNFNPGAMDISANSDGTMPTPVNSIMAALADNGGSTPTHALVPGSPAIDAGSDTIANGAGLFTDQRDGLFDRISVDHVDIGAFEVQSETRISFTGNTLTIDNSSAADEDYTINLAGGKITVQNSGSTPNNTSGGTANQNNQTWTSNGMVGEILTIILTSSGGGLINIVEDLNPLGAAGATTTNFAGAPDLRNVIFDAPNIPTSVDLSGNTNPNIYSRFMIDGTGGRGNNFVKTSPTGINMFHFGDSGNPSETILDIPQDHMVALDFSNLTTVSQDVAINLGNDGIILGGYRNMDIKAAGTNHRRFIDVLVGGPGNDVLIGNDAGNLLIGGNGNDTLIGNGGNDQINANRDFSPDVDNNPNDPDDPYDFTDDLTVFAAQVNQFNSAPGVSATSRALFSNLGIFGFGEGTTDFAGSFALANSLEAPESRDLLNGGPGNDGLFGFNDATVTVLGGPGNDIYSTNTRGGTALIDMGEGADTILFSTGDTAIGGPGNDLITEAAFNPDLANLITFLFGQEDNDTINAGLGPDEVRPGTGFNSINLLDGDDTIISEGGSNDINGDPGFEL